jgi:hypothetical protein
LSSREKFPMQRRRDGAEQVTRGRGRVGRMLSRICLLACVAAAALWAHGRLLGGASVEVVLFGRCLVLEFGSIHSASVRWYSRWPEDPRLCVRTQWMKGPLHPGLFWDGKNIEYHPRKAILPAWQHGMVQLSAWPDGSVRRLTPTEIQRLFVVTPAPLRTAPTWYLEVMEIRYWWVIAVCGALPMFRLLARVRRGRVSRGRHRRGLCIRCGYDLRGTSERCPECGTEPAQARAITAPSAVEREVS